MNHRIIKWYINYILTYNFSKNYLYGLVDKRKYIIPSLFNYLKKIIF
jgi:hypothetical protein